MIIYIPSQRGFPYRSKKLESYEKNKVNTFWAIYVVTAIMIPIASAFLAAPHDEPIIVIQVIQELFKLVQVYTTFSVCYRKQHVDCEFEPFCLTFGILSLFPFFGQLAIIDYLNVSYVRIAVLRFFQCSYLAWFLACVGFQANYCNCKKCNNIKDVKLCYADRYLDVDEREIITAQFLTTRFDLPRSADNFISLQTDNGQIIHTFANDSSTQLHEGRYNILVRSNTGVNIRYMAGNGSSAIPEGARLDKNRSNHEVHIRYLAGNLSKSIPVSTVINEHLLKKWLNVSSNGTIAIQNDENGRIVHAFYEKMDEITLAEGNYTIKVIHMEDETGLLLPSTSNAVLYNAQSSTVTIREEEKEPECTILTVD